jgi:Bacterial capsule synthesis protein PGA_cap
MALKIAFLGDICLTGKFDLESNHEALGQFDQVKSILEEHDYIFANLESPFTDQNTSRVCKSIHIKSPLVNTRILEYLGVSAVSLANNHIFDYGRKGHLSTLTALETAGIGYFGTQSRQFLLEKNGEKLLLGGFCCLSAHPSAAGRKGVNILTPNSVERFLRDSQAQGAFPVASVHWGDENIHYPSEDHVMFARSLAEKHTFLLHGHHPHVIQGLELDRGSLIAYSLGNFCTDEHTSWAVRNMKVRHTQSNWQSYILSVVIKDNKILNHKVIPVAYAGGALGRQGQEAIDQFEGYSARLGSTMAPYRRPQPVSMALQHDDLSSPSRFSIPWILARLNYYFIGAFLKGIVNLIRYQFYFSFIRKKSI